MKHSQQKNLLTLEVKSLEHAPGTQWSIDREVRAPEDIGTVLIGVKPGAELQLSLRIESVLEGALVSGEVRTEVSGECGRCLRPFSHDLTVDLMHLFRWSGQLAEDPDEDEDSSEIGPNGLVDMEPVVRDQVVAVLPFQPLCSPDCPGLCDQCGQRLDEDPDHVHEQSDPRWAALAGLARELNGEESDTRSQPLDHQN